MVVKAPAAAVLPPIIVASIAPPFTSISVKGVVPLIRLAIAVSASASFASTSAWTAARAESFDDS